MMIFRIPPTSSRLHLGFTQPHASLTNPPYLLPTDKWACLPQGGDGQREGSKTMKSWIKYGLAGALILVASFWGGSVRAAEMPLGPDDALPVQITGQDAAVLTGASFLPLGE